MNSDARRAEPSDAEARNSSSCSAPSENSGAVTGRGVRRVLIVLVILGGALRAANLTWGLPLSPDTGFYHPDEVKSWGSTVDFPGNYLTSTNYLYGTAVQYTIGLLLVPVKLALTGSLFEGSIAYRNTAILVFRAVSVLMGTASVILVYLLGRRLWDAQVGLVAAAMLCVSTAHALHSTFCTLDVAMSCLLLAGFVLTRHALETRRTSSFVLLGICAGLLVGTKFTGAFFLVVPLVLACVFARGTRKHGRLLADGKGRQFGRLAVFLFAALLTFAVSSPQVIVAPEEYYRFMMEQKSRWYDRPEASPVAIARTWAEGISTAVGAPAAVLAMLGVATLRRPNLGEKLTIAAFVLGYLAFWRGYLPPRFVIYVAPLFCLLAAATCGHLAGQRRFPLRILGLVLLGMAVLWPLFFTIAGVIQRSRDVRTQAARFLADAFPPGTELGIATDSARYTWRHHQWRYPVVAFDRDREAWWLARPEVIVVTGHELEPMREALWSPRLLPGYRWAPQHSHDWYQNQPPSPPVFRFYEDLLHGNGYERIRTFSHPVPVDVGGVARDVFVYRRHG